MEYDSNSPVVRYHIDVFYNGRSGAEFYSGSDYLISPNPQPWKLRLTHKSGDL
jgi:hypothetical protein